MNTSLTKNTKPMGSILKSILGFIGIYIVSGIIAEICIIIIFTCIGINIFGGDILLQL